MRDTAGRELRLHYFRDSNQREVDFVISEGSAVRACIEVKTSDQDPSPSLRYLAERLKPEVALQRVHNCSRGRDFGVIQMRPLAEWLKQIEL